MWSPQVKVFEKDRGRGGDNDDRDGRGQGADVIEPGHCCILHPLGRPPRSWSGRRPKRTLSGGFGVLDLLGDPWRVARLALEADAGGKQRLFGLGTAFLIETQHLLAIAAVRGGDFSFLHDDLLAPPVSCAARRRPRECGPAAFLRAVQVREEYHRTGK